MQLRLPADKRVKYGQVLDAFADRYRTGRPCYPKQLAAVLGKLNFAAPAIPGGLCFMQRMYDRFRGAVIQWDRNMIRLNGRLGPIYLDEEFWRDFDWWRGRLRAPAVGLSDLVSPLL